MAGYFDQCACGEYTCVGDMVCRQCLEAENKRQKEEIARLRAGLEKWENESASLPEDCSISEYVNASQKREKHLQADLELARLALEEAVVAMDEREQFKDVWAP